MHNLMSWNILNSSHETKNVVSVKQYTSTKTYFASKRSLFSILPWIVSGFWKITYYMQHVTTQSNHPHTFTAGSTPKLGQSLRQCQHQKHGNCFSLWNTPILEFPNVNFLFDLKQHQPPRKYLNTEVTALTGLISSYYHGTWVNTSKPSSAVTEGLAPPRQKCTPCITKMKPWNQSTVILSCRVLENLVRKHIP